MKKVMLTLSATVAAAFFSGCICTETTTVPAGSGIPAAT